jgi:assimilatory nitrate reductase catalytic subunit
VVLKVLESATLRAGQTFVPMHWGANAPWAAGHQRAAAGRFRPYSKQPELKHAAVQVENTRRQGPGGDAPQERRRRPAAPQPLELMQRLRRWLPHFPYASLTLAGARRRWWC